MAKQTQIEMIRTHFKSGFSLTPLEALRNYNCMRLAAVVHVLRNEYNMNIKTDMVTNKSTGKTHAKYVPQINITI